MRQFKSIETTIIYQLIRQIQLATLAYNKQLAKRKPVGFRCCFVLDKAARQFRLNKNAKSEHNLLRQRKLTVIYVLLCSNF